MRKMIIGIDLDNTIICYDDLFHQLAVERKLVSRDFAPRKDKIRNFLRSQNMEPVWTEMQGYVYGQRILEAKPFEGVFEFFSECGRRDVEVHIISHKTQYPFLGPKFDLHDAALSWLEYNRFLDPGYLGLDKRCIHLEFTKEAKYKKIRECACTHFIDDLPEFLVDSNFPDYVVRILFDNFALHQRMDGMLHASSWSEIARIVFGD